MDDVFTGSFTQQEPIPDDGIAAAVDVMQSGRLHRYNIAGDEVPHVVQLEREFADYLGAKYCVAVTSGGYAMATALRAVGVKPGDKVLSNAFTLAPVPGAIASIGAVPDFVGVTRDLTIDLDHLEVRLASSDARVLLLSHMRGHICDMDRLMSICDAAGVKVVEDCAHTMGARWGDVPSGLHGVAACYSNQTYKHMNSGEGGFLVSNDTGVAARAVLMSGSYMFFDRHGAAPSPEEVAPFVGETPNISGRMDNLRAAILRPQLARLDASCTAWTERYRALEDGLRNTPGLTVIDRPEQEHFVGSSIQFLLKDWDPSAINGVVSRAKARGVELKWFGADHPAGFTSTYRHWRYAGAEELPETDAVLRGIVDMRIPLTFSLDDCRLIARIITDEVQRGYADAQAAE
jgi:dTDP-4-amino-4,6-dideoxygalactose transaminase